MAVDLSVFIVTHTKPWLAYQCALSIGFTENIPQQKELFILQSGEVHQEPLEEMFLKGRLRDRFSRVTLIRDTDNIGIVRSMNAMAELAKGTHLLYCNDDLIFDAGGWWNKLLAGLNDPSVGLVCPQLLGVYQVTLPQCTTPLKASENIADFRACCKTMPPEAKSFIEGEANMPWLIRRADLLRFAQQDPIRNQQKFLCEWTDPTGIGWAVDWGSYNQVRRAGFRVGMIPDSYCYHYDHVTCKDTDQAKPGWAATAMARHVQKWGADQKWADGGRQFILQEDGLHPV